jgi:hypothetical protein
MAKTKTSEKKAEKLAVAVYKKIASPFVAGKYDKKQSRTVRERIIMTCETAEQENKNDNGIFYILDEKATKELTDAIAKKR